MQFIKKINGTLKVLLVVVGVMAVVASGVWAQVGGGFDLTWSTIDGGGDMESSGGTFTLGGTIGQPDAGNLSGGTYDVRGGFWYGDSTACVPPSAPIPMAVNSAGSLELSWVDVGVTAYSIYRAVNDPYFMPASVYDTAPASPWTDGDVGAIGDPANNHYYVMRAVGCTSSLDSQRVGEFDFALVPGT